MLERSSLGEKIVEVFHELKEDLSKIGSGSLSIQLNEGRVVAFGLRPRTEQDRGGLTSSQQQCFCLLTIDLLRKRTDWENDKVVLVFELQDRVLRVSAGFSN